LLHGIYLIVIAAIIYIHGTLQVYNQDKADQSISKQNNLVYNLQSDKIRLKNALSKLMNTPFWANRNNWQIINQKIRKVVEKKFYDEHYADAVESAFKEINKQVKEVYRTKTGEERDGRDLMFQAFRKENPTIILNDLSTKSGESVQEGYMYLFAGAMQGIRNSVAHDNLIIDVSRAFHFICFASLLMDKLDEAKIP